MQADVLTSFFETHFPQWNPSKDELPHLTSSWNKVVTSASHFEDLLSLKRVVTKKLFAEQFIKPPEDLQKVLRELSDFYDACLEHILRQVCQTRSLNLNSGGVAVFSLGKLGSQEVNFDSDMDLVIFRMGNLSELELRQWEGVIREVVRVLSQESSQGHLPRPDLNLRPYGASGPLLPSVESAQKFYWHSTDLWNRLAWMRGRFVCGDRRVIEELEPWLPHYVYPKYLDYRLTEHLNQLRDRIFAQKSESKSSAGGWNLKFSKGGIRELEFCVQGTILLHGGRRPEGRSGNIFEGIRYLDRHKLVPKDELLTLSSCYSVLRLCEHVAQCAEGRQTYVLRSEWEKSSILKLALKRYQFSNLDEVFEKSHLLFLKYFQPAPVPQDRVSKLDDASQKLIEPYLNERMTQKWTEEARNRFQSLLPVLLKTLTQFEDPGYILSHFFQWVDKLKIRGGYFHLLGKNPPLLEKLLQILSLNSPLLNEWLAKPRCIENMLLGQWDGTSEFEKYWAQWRQQSAVEIAEGPDILEELRDCRATFTLELVRNQISSPLRWRDHQKIWCGTPDVIMREVVNLLKPKLKSPFRVSWILLGSFGGLTADLYSDLDILVVMSDETAHVKTEIIKLCQRVVQALSLRSSRGVLFPVDLRLRPSGAQGPLIVSESYFLKYALQDARLWEWLSWFRGREVVSISSQTKNEQDQFLWKGMIKKLLEALRTGAKRFSSDDFELLLSTLKKHRETEPHGSKWEVDGLIECEIRARFRAWSKGLSPHDTEELFTSVFSPEEDAIGRENLWSSWHRRMFPHSAIAATSGKFSESMNEELRKSQLLTIKSS